jgi:hypothetical protein
VGESIHVELMKDGFTLGIATLEAAKREHGLRPEGEGRWIEIVLWTDDTDAAVNALIAKGAPLLSLAHDFLDGKLRSAWIVVRTAIRSSWFNGDSDSRQNATSDTGCNASHRYALDNRAVTSALSCRTTAVVLRISASLSSPPMVDAMARNRALISR